MIPILNRAILASRYLLTVFYVGLAVALGLYAIRFVWKLWKYAEGLFVGSDVDGLLGLLYLLDSALVAGLVTMVAISSYDSLVARLSRDVDAREMEWVGAVDPSNLKIKLAVAIVAISSIHLLQIFMKVQDYTDRDITWSLAIHAMFLAGIIALAVMDRLEGYAKAAKAAAMGKAKPAE